MSMGVSDQSGSSLGKGVLMPSREPGTEQAVREYLLNGMEMMVKAHSRAS